MEINQPTQSPITPTFQPLPPTPKKKIPWLVIVLVILLLGATGAFAYKYYQLKQASKDILISNPYTENLENQIPNDNINISPNNAYSIVENWQGDYNYIDILDSNNNRLVQDVIQRNEAIILDKIPQAINVGMSSYSFKGWYSDATFTIEWANGNDDKVEFIITAPSGEVDPNSFRIFRSSKVKEKGEKLTINLYYNDKNLDPDLSYCAVNNSVEIQIPKTTTPIKDTVNALINSEVFPHHPDFYLKSINLKENGDLILEFPFIGSFTTGGSCRIGEILDQIVTTAKQFPEVKNVILDEDVWQI